MIAIRMFCFVLVGCNSCYKWLRKCVQRRRDNKGRGL